MTTLVFNRNLVVGDQTTAGIIIRQNTCSRGYRNAQRGRKRCLCPAHSGPRVRVRQDENAYALPTDLTSRRRLDIRTHLQTGRARNERCAGCRD
jgi:hypothetical protein